MVAGVRKQLRENELTKAEVVNDTLLGIYLRMEALEARSSGPTGATGAQGPTGSTGPPGAGSTGVDFGKFGSYSDDSRVWGVATKTAANSTAYSTWGMGTQADIGSMGAVLPTVASPRAWNSYATGLLLNDVAGVRQTNAFEAMWVQRPRLWALIVPWAALTSRRIWVALGSGNLALFSTVAAQLYVGLRYDSAVSGNWFVCTSDGTTASETDTLIAVVADAEYNIDIDFTVAATLTVKINGASVTKTTDLPSGVGYMKTQVTVTSLLVGTGPTIHWHHTMFSRK